MSNKTAEVLSSMLQENTGRALCDSGDAYGRNWERNQGIDFEKQIACKIEFHARRYTEISVTHNVYHWLKEKLTFDQHMDDVFQAFCVLAGNEDKHWLELMDEFPEYLSKQVCSACNGTKMINEEEECQECDGEEPMEIGGIYGDGNPVTVNTYNGEDLLSQTIQYVYFEVKHGEAYVLLQIHGGADVRGGYTRPRVFIVNEELGIFDNAKASIGCNSGDHYWTTDDGCNWYWDGGSGNNLEDQEVVAVEALVSERKEGIAHQRTITGGEERIDLLPMFKNEEGEEVKWEEGKLFIDDHGNGYCPHCGGKLSAWFY